MDEKKLVFKNAKFVFLGNLSNRNSSPAFGIVIPDDEASELAKAGWNIRLWTAYPIPFSYIMVAIPKGAYAPLLMKNPEDGTLDVTVLGYDWQVQNLSGTKAYLESVTLSQE